MLLDLDYKRRSEPLNSKSLTLPFQAISRPAWANSIEPSLRTVEQAISERTLAFFTLDLGIPGTLGNHECDILKWRSWR